MENKFFLNKHGDPIFVTGLQCHNSSTGSPLIEKAIRAVKKFGGNVLEAPVYWYWLEPQEGVYDVSHIRQLIQQVRDADLKLVILWFATNKNGHPNYVPEYVKTNPKKYRLAVGADGAPVPSMSPHCEATLTADKRAFVELIKCIKEEDQDYGTVLAVQVENETGLGGTDRDYSNIAQRDYEKPVPEVLRDIEIKNSGASKKDSSWRGQFGRYAHEVFTAWHHAVYTNCIASAGKEIMDITMFANAMLGDSIDEAGLSYNSGGPVVRVLDIWKAGAPAIDLLCPDIYNPGRDEYEHFCRAYSRADNPLFIPESGFWGTSSAINIIRAAAEHRAIGICCFGAESALNDDGEINDESKEAAVSFKIVNSIAPLLIKYHGTERIYPLIQEEFTVKKHIETPGYHITANFDIKRMFGKGNPSRGRGILVQTDEHEFYLSGDNVGLDFLRRPDPDNEIPYIQLKCRQATQLNFLTVEEGHFEDGKWVADFCRNGDQSNYELYANDGEIVRIRLNPHIGL
jgi:hypothetical protein